MSDTNETLYKVLNADGTCYHGGQGKWFLPRENAPGKWMPRIKDIKPCVRGYHLLRREQIIQWIAPVALFTVEARGESQWTDDKGVFEQARLLRRLPNWTEQAARLFACDCAEKLRQEVPTNEHAEFDACLLIIRRHAFKMATETELEQARAWARARARAGARAWARARAWEGARVFDAEWQTQRLFEYVDGQVDLDEIKGKVTR